jgi:hypothetical protein
MQKHQTPWTEKVQELFQTCSEEIKRTTEIGKKMLTASKTNTSLHEAYEELGRLAADALESKQIDWEDPKVHDLIHTIKSCQEDLETLEEEVNTIKSNEKSKEDEEKSNS